MRRRRQLPSLFIVYFETTLCVKGLIRKYILEQFSVAWSPYKHKDSDILADVVARVQIKEHIANTS
jgi:hypothetical protein